MSGELIERYPGPGEYCPDCGERLRQPPGETNGTPSEPLTPEAYEQFQSRMLETWEALTPPPPRSGVLRRVALACIAVLAIVVAWVFFAWRPWSAASAAPVHVCGSSLTRQVAGDLVRAFAAQTHTPATRFDLSGDNGCDVRFSVATGASRSDAIALDGVVVVVHPRNPIGRLSEAQVRGIVGGSIADWSQVGGAPGRIEPVLPDESTDERRAIAATVLLGTRVAPNIRTAHSSVEIARYVSSASGMRRIGIAAFSSAVPAKVLPIGTAPIPSVLSIENRSYPLVLAVVVDAADAHNAAARALAKFARSADAQPVIARDGLVTKGGV